MFFCGPTTNETAIKQQRNSNGIPKNRQTKGYESPKQPRRKIKEQADKWQRISRETAKDKQIKSTELAERQQQKS
jgi:hypothetical protein